MGEKLDYTGVIDELRKSYETGVINSLDARLKQLHQFNRMLEENEQLIEAAVYKDLRKHKFEALISEVFICYKEVRSAINNLQEWTKPQKVEKDLLNKMNVVEIQSDPLGVVLIIGAWNYPFVLSVGPMIGALAAGNCVVVKPSELSVHTTKLLEDLIPRYFNQDCVRIIAGGIPETTALLRCRFDHILYTGSSAVGKIIMRAAAENLTPVTLELGGKSPAIVDSTCDFDMVGQRVAWGKCLNNGQTCLAIDYVICVGGCQEKLIASVKKALVKFYGEDPQKSDSYGRIINKRHFQRICNLIDPDKVVHGNIKDEDDLYISPTIMANVADTDKVMQEEIFGPVLPIKNFTTILDAVSYIRAREKPLGLYVYSKNNNVIELVKKQTSSGGMVVNDALMHFGVDSLPFGGVGNSGMGAYHGKYSFDTFSHKKAYLQTKQAMERAMDVRYPPYNPEGKALKLLRWVSTPSLKSGIPFSKIFFFCMLILVISVILPRIQSHLK